MNKTRDAAAAIADQAAIDIDNSPGASTKYREGMIDGCQRVAKAIRALPDSDADKVIAELVGALEAAHEDMEFLLEQEKHCGDPNHECPMQDCFSPGGTKQVFGKVSKALAKAREYMEE